jgi:hypothetical protein
MSLKFVKLAEIAALDLPGFKNLAGLKQGSSRRLLK